MSLKPSQLFLVDACWRIGVSYDAAVRAAIRGVFPAERATGGARRWIVNEADLPRIAEALGGKVAKPGKAGAA